MCRWQYDGELRTDKDLLVAIDKMIDIIRLPYRDARREGRFAQSLKDFFRTNDMDLDPKRVRGRVLGLRRHGGDWV